MGRRVDLQKILEAICPNVYFQVPSTPMPVLTYPCIVYTRMTGDTQYADDLGYIHFPRYTVQVISRDPDYIETIERKILDIPMCTSDRHYVVDNLYHDTYNLYY